MNYAEAIKYYIANNVEGDMACSIDGIPGTRGIRRLQNGAFQVIMDPPGIWQSSEQDMGRHSFIRSIGIGRLGPLINWKFSRSKQK